MKKILTIVSLCIFLITSCSENESITQGSSTEFKGLSKDQLTEISVSQVTKLTVNDESYISSSKYLREKIINSSTSKRKKSLEFGDYYSIVDHQNRELKLLRIGGEDSDQQYFVEMNDEYYFLDFALNSADGEDTSNFTFIVSDINGNLLSDSNNGRTQKAWWSCVQSEFYKMCMTSALREIMCGAAGLGCPECGLIVYGAWMISCAWD